MPRLSVAPFNRSSPHCRHHGARRPPTLSPTKPLHHLDAAHFYSTGTSAGGEPVVPTPHDGDGSPQLPSVVGGNVAEEYRLLASATETSEPAGGLPRRHHHGYLELLDLDALRIVFLLLDALLLLYRITNVYSGGLVVSRHFEDDLAGARGRWATWKTSPGTVRARAPSPIGATNYVDASDYIQPIEQRSVDPSAPSRLDQGHIFMVRLPSHRLASSSPSYL